MTIGKLKLTALVAVAAAFGATEAMATTWNVSVWGKRRAFTEHIHKLGDLVAEKTNGEFTFNISYGGLSNEKENLDGISIGAFEMAQFCAGYHPDKNPTLTVLELPFLGVNTLEEEVAVSNAVYGHPATQKDLARWNARLLMTSPMPQYNVAGVGKAPEKLEDYQGMRIRATGGIGEAFRTIGATPTSVTSAEAYNAMESGVVDSVAFAQHAHFSFRTIDLAKWWTTNLNPGTVNCPVVVNIDAYEALSDAERQALDESIDEAIAYYIENYGEVFKKWEAALNEKGVQRVTYTDDQIAVFEEQAAGAIRKQWLEEMTAQGLPAEELLQTVKDALKESRGGS
ncbi:C4-dicarboxylate TRAP transporter substrate-binding protein [Limibaculum sp. M0105]|uniref:C4-dicarboxylate TRAP transporter substrate-binding protein n=1 Tax=Thermohalobaculum xanthum TaxID=2753746 RepID=A0A8J7M7W0_9RHOB|nr:C4-dicarboxylate TRAP transporter substrate-binding protein [Thermohalobaculum xanthum]MBK0399835.1 C4-dicarboxylate TRAP transporter substrate-binding protein [Thermohalobaculum xanthum]